MKGIILAGGKGRRMDPVSRVVNKHLLPVYNKPVIYYPLTTLISLGVTHLLIITSSEHIDAFHTLLNGTTLGIKIEFAIQDKPSGLPEAFIIGEKFIGGDPVALALGDNLFWGPRLQSIFDSVRLHPNGATIFTRRVEDPKQFGVLVRDNTGEPIDIVEKPDRPISHEAVTGLYLFDGEAASRSKVLRPSERGELEITHLLRTYLSQGKLRCKEMGGSDDGVEWYDAGTPDNIVLASTLIRGAEHDGLLVGSPEAAAYKRGLITKEQLLDLASQIGHESYARNLRELAR